MKPRDLLLALSGLCITVAGGLVALPLGLAAAGLTCAAAWWLLGEST